MIKWPKCPHCGWPLYRDRVGQYCTWCNYEWDGTDVSRRFCPGCGELLAADQYCCDECGHVMNAALRA
jgi:hypothetical protein